MSADGDGFAIDIVGLEDLEARMDAWGPEFSRRALKKGVWAGAEVLCDAARANAPVLVPEKNGQRRPGELRDSIEVIADPQKVLAPSYESVTVSPAYTKANGVQDPGVWGKFVEYGSVHNPVPEPYLRPALDEQGEAAIERCIEVMAKELEAMPEAPAAAA